MLAALGFMSGYPAEVFHHVVTVSHYQGQFHLLSQGLHPFQAVLVLQVGVNVGVIPQGADFIALVAPVVNGIGGAVGAAAMNQN